MKLSFQVIIIYIFLCIQIYFRKFFQRKIKSMLYVSTGAITIFSGLCAYKGDEDFYKKIIMPLVHLLDPELAHKFAIFASQHRIVPKNPYKDPKCLVKFDN